MPNILPFASSGMTLSALHRAMLAAFSDYIVPMQPDADRFFETLNSRGFDPDASYIAVENDEVAGFWNVATRNNRRYLIGSGTRINHRRKGIAEALGVAATNAAKTAGIDSFWLEVIEGNEGAERLYRKLGFDVTRKLDCYRLDHPQPSSSSCEVSDFGTVAKAIHKYATWEPTWQNATDTISDLEVTCFLQERGGVIVGAGGLVHQIAADSASGLKDLIAAAGTIGPLTLVNLDTGDRALSTLLSELGAQRFLVQSEMCLTFPQSSEPL